MQGISSQKRATGSYAFGMVMDGRSWTAGSGYRYGFNGKEDDPETGTQNYGFRIYNTGLCRFLSVDPLTKEYPWNSTYAFAENDIIRCIDIEGAEKYVIIRCWDHGKFIGSLCIFLPSDARLRKNEKTMVFNAELTTEQIQYIRNGKIFTYQESDREQKISGLTDLANEIIYKFNRTSTGFTRVEKLGARITLVPANQSEQKQLQASETRFNAGFLGNQFLIPEKRTINYNLDKFNTSELGAEKIQIYKDYLLKNPDFVITVTGYTDKTGSTTYNKKLGLKRAKDFKDFLIANGINGDRIVTVSKGEEEATVAEDASKDDREADRKVVIEWTPKK